MNIFNHIAVPKVKRSTFNLSHDVRLTCDMSELVPILCEEVIPNDTWKVDTNVLVRFAPLIAPVMHKINVFVHFWYVPMRIVWDEFPKFITGENEAKQPPQNPPLFPSVELLDSRNNSDYYDTDGLWSHGTLADYLGYPTSEEVKYGGGMHVNALPFRAYQMIYDNFYRDENLQEALNVSKESGVTAAGSEEYVKLLTLRHRAWAKDYFTSALPFVQKGRTQPVPVTGTGTIPSNTKAPIVFDPNTPLGASDNAEVWKYAGGQPTSLGGLIGVPNYGDSSHVSLGTNDDYAIDAPLNIDNSDHLKANLSNINVVLQGLGFTINDLRRANAIQKWLERNARGGSRYIEAMLAHFGVISDNLELQLPEFLGGAQVPVQVGDVLQTSQTTDSSPQAEYAGVGFSRTPDGKLKFKKTFKERGYVMAIMSIMPKPTYMEGLPRKYRITDKFDLYFPEFSYLGEEPVYNYELALRGENHQDVFGYVPRYARYKYLPSTVHGDFKNLNGLGYWTLARHYDNQPSLSSEFIECNNVDDDLDRIFAVKEEDGSPVNYDHLFVSIHHDIKCRRPMPYLPEPSL